MRRSELAEEHARGDAVGIGIEQQFGIAVNLIIDQVEFRCDAAARSVYLRGPATVRGRRSQSAAGLHRHARDWSAVVDIQRSGQRGAVVDESQLAGNILFERRLIFRRTHALKIQREAALHGADATALISGATGAVHAVIGINFDQLGACVGRRDESVGRK